MKFCWGMPPDTLATDPQKSGWTKLESSADYSRLRTFVAMNGVVLAVLATGHLAWLALAPTPWQESFLHALSPATLVLMVVVIIVVHEGLHVLAQPSFGLSDRTIVGVIPKLLAPYAMYCGVLTRTRHLTVLLAPFVVLTLIPGGLLFVVPSSHGELAFLAIVNAASSVMDVRNVVELLRFVPPNATLGSHAGSAWWK